MISLVKILYIITFIIVEQANSQLSKNKDDLLNWCLVSISHKLEPGKEDALHEQCSPWKDHACCTEEISLSIHEKNMYNFSFDHCSDQTGLNMSENCRRHFVQDSCFYECEPHIGLWVVNTSRKIAAERFYKVPLCASDCHSWYDACKDDYTCAYNWPRDFKFSKGRNLCKEGSKCQKFSSVYHTSKEFCENVWDHSWEFTPDDKPCMRIWFNGSVGNPNRKVAEYYIDERFSGDASSINAYMWPLFIGFVFSYLALIL